MRFLPALALAPLLVPLAARADDTKPPVIAEVKATQRGGQVQIEARITDETGVLSATCHHRSKGGRWEDAPMIRNDYDDVFKVSFASAGDTEYWIESTDILGNGPATYGAAGRPMAVAGGKPPDEEHAGPPHRPPPPRPPPPPPPPKPGRDLAKAGPPVIEHRKPTVALPDGQEVTLRAKVHGDVPIAFTGVFLRNKGEAGAGTRLSLDKVEGDNYEARIPADKAHGTVEYALAAKDEGGRQSFAWDGNPNTWFTITFKPRAPAEQTYAFAVNPPARVQPGQPVTVRAQITSLPPSDEPTVPAKAQVIWRGSGGQDQVAAMEPDTTGGLGGFKAQIPPQPDGAVYYQVVACDASGGKCAVSTGSKRKWHAVAVAAVPGAKPAPLDAPSSKAPGSLPE